jgi:hypothetical protein
VGQTLDFREEAVAALMVQAMWQTGPFAGGSAYSWEEDFQNEDIDLVHFACQPLEELAKSVADNWDAATQLCSTIVIGLRIFEATKGDASAKRLLQVCANTASRWIVSNGPMAVARDLLSDLSEQQSMDERMAFIASLVLLAYRPEWDEDAQNADNRVQQLLLAANLSASTSFEDPKSLEASIMQCAHDAMLHWLPRVREIVEADAFDETLKHVVKLLYPPFLASGKRTWLGTGTGLRWS